MVAVNPFGLPGEWLKGNTHCHTNLSDGELSPGAVADWYAGHGYDFLSITDHRILTSHAEIERAGMIGVPGMEVNGWDEASDCEYHVVALGLKDLQALPPGRSLQGAINNVKEDGAVTILAHPHWLGFEVPWLESIRELDCLEIFNATCQLLNGKGYAGQTVDGLLALGNRFGLIASDDTHWRGDDAGKGWLHVRVEERTSAAICEAIMTGAFYGTQAPEIHDFQIEDQRVIARTSPATEVRFMSWRGTGQVLHAEGDPQTEWAIDLRGGEKWVRLECVAPDGKVAWSNPIYL
jgi:hypothetical protein